MTLILASKKDVASMNISQQIISLYKFERSSERFKNNPVYCKKMRNIEVKLIFIDEESVYTQYINEYFSPRLLIVVSRHSSRSGIPTLSVHTPGNLSEAKLGGISRKVSISPASAMKDAMRKMVKMREEMNLNYEVSYECTHHGPSLDFPVMFVELGSSPKQWKDLKAAEAVAHAAMAPNLNKSTYPASLGIGGPHYNKKFTRIALNNMTAFAHIIPKYAIPFVDEKVIRDCVERTVEEVESIILDWKGIRGADKSDLLKILNKIGIPVEKV